MVGWVSECDGVMVVLWAACMTCVSELPNAALVDKLPPGPAAVIDPLTAAVIDPLHQGWAVLIKVLQDVACAHDVNAIQVDGSLSAGDILGGIFAGFKQICSTGSSSTAGPRQRSGNFGKT